MIIFADGSCVFSSMIYSKYHNDLAIQGTSLSDLVWYYCLNDIYEIFRLRISCILLAFGTFKIKIEQ